MLERLRVPVVQAPMAGGPSTPALAAAVGEAGGLGFLAAGYLSAAGLGEQVAELRERTAAPFGVNVFLDRGAPADPAAVAAYAARLQPLAARAGVALGEPRHDDDDLQAKLALLLQAPPAVVSFTFGCPEPGTVAALQARGAAVWVTVTEPHEALAAAAAGADALVAQGIEAGGHRGTFADEDGVGEIALPALLALVRRATAGAVPVVASGGIADAAGVAAARAAGAAAVQVGTAFLRTPEAGTSEPHRAALAAAAAQVEAGPPSGTALAAAAVPRTGLTRAFSGRRARGLVNAWQAEHTPSAPRAYPEVHHLTAPLRAHGRATGDPDLVNLWAGQAFALAREEPAAAVVARLAGEA